MLLFWIYIGFRYIFWFLNNFAIFHPLEFRQFVIVILTLNDVTSLRVIWSRVASFQIFKRTNYISMLFSRKWIVEKYFFSTTKKRPQNDQMCITVLFLLKISIVKWQPCSLDAVRWSKKRRIKWQKWPIVSQNGTAHSYSWKKLHTDAKCESYFAFKSTLKTPYFGTVFAIKCPDDYIFTQAGHELTHK